MASIGVPPILYAAVTGLFMGHSGSSSFRRMLLSRILLLSIPVLLAGEYVVYRKARSAVLITARYNLMESATRKASELQAMTAMVRSNVLFASQLFTTQTTPPAKIQSFLKQVKTSMPPQVQCVQMVRVATGQLAGSTCGALPLAPDVIPQVQHEHSGHTLQPLDVLISPRSSPLPSARQEETQNQLRLVFSVPVYDAKGQFIYILQTEASLRQQVLGQISLQGYAVVVNEAGKILAHPLPERIGQSITQFPNPPMLRDLLRSAIAGEQDSFHLFEENGAEWLAGYTAVSVPIVGEMRETWVIMAIAPISNALYEIRDIQSVLLWLTLGLLVASVVATWLMTRDLAKPLEKLGAYALQIRQRGAVHQPPKNFKIRELNQLAEALEVMVQKLNERAEELETAWQEAQAANQLKSEFLATTSHELRTPLNAIIGSIRLVKDGCCDGPEEVEEFLQQADNAAIHLLKIINDLLDISKIEVGQIELHLQLVDIHTLCQQCLQMVTPSADRKHIDVGFVIDPDLKKVLLDERRVRQMLINLLSNAVKFTPEGGTVKLTAWHKYGADLEAENRPDRSPINPETPYLCLDVTDSGIGIAPERWHLLFRPFQQIDASSTRNYEGTGLGLALTKRLVEIHGGTLSFTSAVDQGSTFKIWLPIPVTPVA